VSHKFIIREYPHSCTDICCYHPGTDAPHWLADRKSGMSAGCTALDSDHAKCCI